MTDRNRDGGFTLVESLISMTIMLVVMLMFTTGVLRIFRSANTTEQISVAQSQVYRAFQRIDKEIRYAAGISTPGTVGGSPHVEFLTTHTGSNVCVQLRLDVSARQLQRRTWTLGAGPDEDDAWFPLASEVSAATPFSYLPPAGAFTFQRLRIRLEAAAAAGTGPVAATDVTFTALNTDPDTESTTVCGEGRT
jgi:prepilin-type N-terminal cleavage/methylation domain-containing protein